MVSYATKVKRELLRVTAEQVVSADCAAQMAAGVQALLGVDWALSTTGVAGPDGVQSAYFLIEGDRGAIRSSACARALELLLTEVSRG